MRGADHPGRHHDQPRTQHPARMPRLARKARQRGGATGGGEGSAVNNPTANGEKRPDAPMMPGRKKITV